MIIVLGRAALGPAEGPSGRPLAGLAARVALEAARRGATVELVGSIGEDAAGDRVAVELGRAGVGHAALLRDPAGVTPVLDRRPAGGRESAAGGLEAMSTGDDFDAPRKGDGLDAPRTGDDFDAPRSGDPGATRRGPRVVGGPLPRLDAADVELGLRYLSDARVLVVADPLSDDAAAAAIDAAGYHGAAVVAIVGRGLAIPPAYAKGVTVLEAPETDDDADDPFAAFAGFVAAFAVGLDGGEGSRQALAAAAAGAGWERAAQE